MNKKFTDEQQQQLIGHLTKKGFYRGANIKITIFLCGGDVANHQSWRHQLSQFLAKFSDCLLYTSPSPRDKRQSRMPSSA